MVANMRRPKLVRGMAEVSAEIVNSLNVEPDGAGCIGAALEFVQHRLAQSGHSFLL